jgi:hypothetical protein
MFLTLRDEKFISMFAPHAIPTTTTTTTTRTYDASESQVLARCNIYLHAVFI